MKNKSLTNFFLLAFIFALPSYILISMAANGILFSPGDINSFVPLATLAPIGAAAIVTFKESGLRGTKALLGRVFDFKRVNDKRWYLPTLLLMPLLLAVAYPINILLRQPITEPLFPVTAVPVMIPLIFVGSLGEEVGWMGYAIEPLQSHRQSAKAAALLGVIWALWHIPLYIYTIIDPVVIVAQIISLIALRIIIVWLFNNTGKSVFLTILFHAAYNVAMFFFPVNIVTTSLLTIITALGITYLWGPNTLAGFSWRKKKAII